MNIKDKITEVVFIQSMKNGFDNVSIKQIQEESGIAIGTIYYHFKDKNEILIYMVNRYIVEDFYRMKKELLNLNVSFMEKIDFIIKYTFQSYNTKKIESEDISEEDSFDYRDYWTLYTNISHDHPEIKHVFHELSDKLHELYLELVQEGIENKEIREDVDPEIISIFIQTILKGHIYLFVYQPSLSVDEVLEANIKMIQEAIKPKN